jgi:hypothetical protein
MAVVLGVGLGAQATQAAIGSWTVGGPDRIDPAYGLVDQPPLVYRVLWLGEAAGDAFPAPGGLPDGVVAAGSASVRFAVRDPNGASALDIGRPSQGSGYDRLAEALEEIMAGPTRHGGALLAPFGIRFVVARLQDLPPASYRRLARQIDLDQIPTEGLIVFRDDTASEEAAVVQSVEWRRTAPSGDPVGVEMLPRPDQRALASPSDETFTGDAITRPSLVFLAQQFDGRWRLDPPGGESVSPIRAFGWAVAFRVDSAPAGWQVRYGGQAARTLELGLLALLWAAALWLTRRPVRGG